MKVQIEKTIHDVEDCLTLNNIVKICLDHKFKHSCCKILQGEYKDNKRFSFGASGSHMWVSYKNERVLLITEDFIF